MYLLGQKLTSRHCDNLLFARKVMTYLDAVSVLKKTAGKLTYKENRSEQ